MHPNCAYLKLLYIEIVESRDLVTSSRQYFFIKIIRYNTNRRSAGKNHKIETI